MMLIGAVIGLLLARISELGKRISKLESSQKPSLPDSMGQWGQSRHSEPLQEQTNTGYMEAESRDEPESKLEKPTPGWQQPKSKKAVAGPSLLRLLINKASSWITAGNVPVKIGVIITFIGVSFLLKYAVDHELLIFPIEFRLIAVSAAGLAMMVIGWRLREKIRVYSLSLQGGGAGILFLTVFASFRLFDLIPASGAFVALVVITAITGALAVKQNARWLAIMGMTGGFLAPVLTSTGQGNHVALFSYYLILNGAILGISWFHAWRSLNLLGFIFTFFIGSLWGYQYYKPELMTSTMPFLVLHFVLYQAVAILYALRQREERIGLVDGTLVFGTPAIVFALQSQLVEGTEYGLAISAVIAAAFYAITAFSLKRSKGEQLMLLTESYIALAVAFATMAIPLALDARWTSAAWALEGAALVWIGMRQGRHLANLAGAALIVLSGVAFMDFGWKSGRGMAVFNGNVLGGLMISLSAFFASRKLKALSDQRFANLYWLTGISLFVWAVLWWLGTGFMEVFDRETRFKELHIFTVFVALSAACATGIGKALKWSMLRDSSFIFLPLFILLALFVWITDQHFLFSIGWLAWPLVWAVQVFVLRLADASKVRFAPISHFFSLLVLTLMVALEAYWWVDRSISDVWGFSVFITIPGVFAFLVWGMRQKPVWPVPAHPTTYLKASIFLVVAQALYLSAVSIADPGDPSPLPYIPVFNPLDLAMVFGLVTAVASLGAIRKEENGLSANNLQLYKLILAALFFIATTAALVRGVHHYTGIRWDGDDLANSVIVQTSLSIYWGLLGFTGMILGARAARRPVWLVGAGFMALVVLKLFLVDLGNSGTVERIVSFIGIGALLLVVGYFAPAPPKGA